MLKKNEYNLMSTIKNYIFYFLEQKERKNINNLMIRRMWLNFNIQKIGEKKKNKKN